MSDAARLNTDAGLACSTFADGLSREYLMHNRVCPKTFAPDGTLIVATGPGAQLDALDDLAIAYRCRVVGQDISGEELERQIERMATQAEPPLELTLGTIGQALAADDDLTTDARDLATQPPVVRYVNFLVREAYDSRASDIHLEATPTGLAARFRLDGVLLPAPEAPQRLHHAIVSRIKLLAELDIAERRRPQDGRIRVRLKTQELDLRVSTVPTMFGESVVLRLLDHGGHQVTLDELGMPSPILMQMERLAERPHGMILVSGPTGSGKTTTLYAALQRRRKAAEKILTVEDPIEYRLSGVTQVPVHRQAGITFGAALRSILRQDPDVLMIGEMRDHETAELAVQAAMTGHLVFSTLHTNDAIGAIPRLLDLGVPSYLVAATVEAVLAQRLVRRICDACRLTYRPSAESIAAVAGRALHAGAQPMSLTRGAGCAECRGTGYKGRIGVFELLLVTGALKDAISCGAARAELIALAKVHEMPSLRTDGWQKVQAGITTVEEVLRVVQE